MFLWNVQGTFKRNIERTFRSNIQRTFTENVPGTLHRKVQRAFLANVRRTSPRVEIPLSFLISSWVLVGPGPEFPYIEKTGRGTVSTRLVFLGQKKLIGVLSGASEKFVALLKYGKSVCIWRGPD